MPYTVCIEIADAREIANKEKFMPKEFMNVADNNIQNQALNYFLSLIHGEIHRITENSIQKHFTIQESILK